MPASADEVLSAELKRAVKALRALDGARPEPGSLASVPWGLLGPAELARGLREAARPEYLEDWMGLADGGWVRDAFMLVTLKAWEGGRFLTRFGKARFSASVALRAACQDQAGLTYREGQFAVVGSASFRLLQRVNDDLWEPQEVVEEAHGLFTGAQVLHQVLTQAGAGPLGAAMMDGLREHRGAMLKLLSTCSRIQTVWVD